MEVKGPRDRLSSKQVVWLSRLIEWGANVEVCRVKGKSTGEGSGEEVVNIGTEYCGKRDVR